MDKIFTSEELYQHFVLKIDVLTVDELEKMNIKTLAKAVGGILELARKEAKHVIWKDNPIPAYYRLPQQERRKERHKNRRKEGETSSSTVSTVNWLPSDQYRPYRGRGRAKE